MWTVDPDRRTRREAGSRRPLVLAAVVGGAVLQHLLVSMPVEPAAVPLPVRHVVLSAVALSAPTAPALTVRHAAVRARPGAAVHVRRPGAVPRVRVTAAARPVSVVKGAHMLAPAAWSAPLAPDGVLTGSVRRAFHAYALPYEEESALIVAVGRQFGIDPSIPAGLFMHEDGNINNRAIFPDHMNWLLYHTLNPGNIKCMYQPCYRGFQVYPTYRAGILDWFRLYDHYYVDLGIHDLGRFVATYCPPNVDGNGPPALYQNDVLVKAARIRVGWR